MNPHHHLDPSTVVSYAAGALTVEVAIVAATHLETCAHCRARVQEAERIGGQLVEHQQPAQPSTGRLADLRAAMLDVMRFWLDRGVDGFRIDVLWHILKAIEFPDNPPMLSRIGGFF